MNSGRGLQRKGVRERTHAEAPAENIDSRTSTTAARQSNPGDSMIGGRGGAGCFGIHRKNGQNGAAFHC